MREDNHSWQFHRGLLVVAGNRSASSSLRAARWVSSDRHSVSCNGGGSPASDNPLAACEAEAAGIGLGR